MNDERALLALILAEPESDAHRLVYADWLEGEGQQERCDFIRCQIAIAQWHEWASKQFLVLPESREGQYLERLKQRQVELWKPTLNRDMIKASKLATILLPGNEAPAWMNAWGIVRRGFLDEVHSTLANWIGGPCIDCLSSGKSRRPHFIDAHPDWECRVCGGTGTLPGHGPALVRQQPIRRVVITDKKPVGVPGQYRWYGSHRTDRQLLSDVLPEVIFEREGIWNGHKCTWYDSEQAALDSLSAACILWAKNAQSPSPIPGAG